MLNFIIGVICTLIWLQIVKLLKEEGVIIKYLTTPVTKRFEFDWTTRQLLALINKGASERWYEARAYCHQNILISILTTLHLIWVVRIEMGFHEEDDMYYGKYSYFHGFRSYKSLTDKCFSKEFFNSVIDYKRNYYYQTFICGHNVVHDFMTNTTYE